MLDIIFHRNVLLWKMGMFFHGVIYSCFGVLVGYRLYKFKTATHLYI